MKINPQFALLVCFQLMVSAAFGEPITPREFSLKAEECLKDVGNQTTAIIRQIQTEVAPTNSKAKVVANLEHFGKSIASSSKGFREEELAEAVGFEKARQGLLEYLDWYQNDAIANLGKAADVALSPTLQPANKKQIINGIFSSIVEQDRSHLKTYLDALEAIRPPSPVAVESRPINSASYELGKVLGTLITSIIVFVLGLMFWLRSRKRNPNYQIARARIAANRQSDANRSDPY